MNPNAICTAGSLREVKIESATIASENDEMNEVILYCINFFDLIGTCGLTGGRCRNTGEALLGIPIDLQRGPTAIIRTLRMTTLKHVWANRRRGRREDCTDGLMQETPSAHICPVAFMHNQAKGPDFIQQMHRSGLNGGASTRFVIVVP